MALKIKFELLAVLSDLVPYLQPHPAAPCSLHTHLAVVMSGFAVTCPPPLCLVSFYSYFGSPAEHPLPAELVPAPGPPLHSGGVWTHPAVHRDALRWYPLLLTPAAGLLVSWGQGLSCPPLFPWHRVHACRIMEAH